MTQWAHRVQPGDVVAVGFKMSLWDQTTSDPLDGRDGSRYVGDFPPKSLGIVVSVDSGYQGVECLVTVNEILGWTMESALTVVFEAPRRP